MDRPARRRASRSRMLGQSGWSSASNGGTTSTYSPWNAPAYAAGSSPAERQSGATAGAARSRIESDTIVPKAWLTDGSPSEAATTGAARSPLSYTIASARQARATSSSAGSFSGAWPCAKRYEKTYGRRSSARQLLDRRPSSRPTGRPSRRRGPPRGERLESLGLDDGMPRGRRGERNLVAARPQRSRKREQRAEVPVERRRREQHAHPPIIPGIARAPRYRL